jgi:uncharacterized membrane protein YbhN (UPF0104 family)
MGDSSFDSLLRKVVIVVVLAAMAYLVAAVSFGLDDLLDALSRIGPAAFAIGMLVSLFNFGLRFARWWWMFRSLDVQSVPVIAQLRIYLAGLALTATPGKVGETVRSALLLRFHVPVGKSLAAFVADRSGDLAGVLLLCMFTAPNAALRWSYATAVAAVLAVTALVAFSARSFSVKDGLQRALQKLGMHRIGHWADDAAPGFSRLWTWKAAPFLILVGMLAYGMQGLVFLAYGKLLWPTLDSMFALHLFSASTLAGAASMLPGGLGAMELALFSGLALAGLPSAIAAAIVLTIRAVTLWFGIAIGVLAMLLTPQHSST